MKVTGYIPQTKLIEATVISKKVINHKVQVQLLYSNSLIWVKVINNDAPSEGQLGLVLFKNSEDEQSGIWLGNINDPTKESRKTVSANNIQDVNTMTSKNENSYVACADAAIVLKSHDNVFSVNKSDAKINIGENNFEINSNNIIFDVKNEGKVISEIKLNNSVGIKSAGSFDIQTINDFNVRIHTGCLVISGGPNTNISTTTEDKYKHFKTLLVKNTETIINSSNMVNINSAGMNIKLLSGRFGGGGGIPGSGPSDTYSLEVVEGNIAEKVGTGNIDIINNNFGIIGKVNIRNGSIISPLQNSLSFSAYNALLDHQVTWGIGSSIDLTKAGINVKATNGITMTSILKDIALQATTDISLTSLLNTKINASLNVIIDAKVKAQTTAMMIELKAKTKAMMEAAIIEIKGKSLTKIETAMLNLVASKIINAGPKTVAPTGTGPFCALPTCLFTGAPHSGDKAVG